MLTATVICDMSDTESIQREIGFGQEVYDKDGTKLGTVEEGIEALSAEHVVAGASGEATLVWRCSTCGAVGDIAEMSDSCPDCGAAKEDIYYWQED